MNVNHRNGFAFVSSRPFVRADDISLSGVPNMNKPLHSAPATGDAAEKTSALKSTGRWRHWSLRVLAAALMAGGAGTAMAGTDLASEPIFGRSSDVKPNLMVLMDTSNSMTWTHMPDNMERPRPATVLASDTTHAQYRQRMPYKSALCNYLYYDPNRQYVLPKDHLGGNLPMPNFNAAPYNYYGDLLGEPPEGVVNGLVDLATQFRAHDLNTVSNKVFSAADPAQPAYYFDWVNRVTGLPDHEHLASYRDGTPAAQGYWKNACGLTDHSSLPTFDTGQQFSAWAASSFQGRRWQRVIVSGEAQKQNFAIWYTYYRNRLSMTKSAMARAMDNLDARYRLGFITALPGLPLSGEFPPALTLNDYAVKPGRFLGVDTFTGTHRADWYATLKNQTAEGTSPMREALARVGRYYGGKEDSINLGMPATGNKNPIVDACQRNYTIMTTDGYWNVNHELQGGGPLQLDGVTRVGNQDGGAAYTSDDGLVPRGVFESQAGALPATISETRTNTFRMVDCNQATVNRKWTTQLIKTTKNTYLNVDSSGGGGIWVQKREIRNQQRTWKVRRTDLRNELRTNSFKEIKRQHTARLNENTVLVPHCTAPYNAAPYSNCTTISNQVSASNPSCQAVSGSSPDWLHTICEPITVTAGVEVCPDPTNLQPGQTCVLNVPVNGMNNTLVAGSQCPSDAPATSASGWISRTCTIEYDVTTSVATCLPNLNASTGNRTCSSVDTGWLPSPLAEPPQAIACTKQNPAQPPHVFVDCRGICPAGQTCSSNGAAVPSCPFTTGSNGEQICNTVTTSIPVAPGTCVAQSPDAGNGYTTISCATTTTPQVTLASCDGVAEPASADNGWTQTHCQTLNNGPGKILQHYVNVTRSTQYGSGTPVTTTEANTGWQWLSGDAPVSPLPQYPFEPVITNLGQHVRDVMGMPHALICVAAEQLPPSPSPSPLVRTRSWEETGTVVQVPSINSLADVAQYYYATDLRNTMANNVPAAGVEWYSDKVPHQHMTTFVVGLGVSGEVKYQENYLTAGVEGVPSNCAVGNLDFPRIRNGHCAWPQWPLLNSNGTENTVAINQGNLRSIDDFFHAAVNGRGRYFNANNPDTLVGALSGALSLIDVSTAFGAGAGLPPRANPQERYQTSYDNKLWFGDLVSAPLLTGAPLWSASEKLASMVGETCDDRNIWVANYVGSSPTKHPFAWDTTSCTGGVALPDLPGPLKAMYQSQHNSVVQQLSQYPEMTNGSGGTVNQRAQLTPQSLLNYIRGQRQNEGFEPNTSGKLFRNRVKTDGSPAPLGDIIGSKPVVVGPPSHRYTDASYEAFKTQHQNRRELVYVGSNGGMLHAFNAKNLEATGLDNTAGREAWAFIPQTIARDLWVLADTSYAGKKRYFVDGTPVVRDIKKPDGTWITLLVGGFNAGGRGYYALDVTHPADPKPLWEINKDTPVIGSDVGYSFGQPKVVRLKDAAGTWAVLLPSGHRTESDTGLSGKGKLFVINAATGALIKELDTGAGTAENPAGLAHVNDWVIGVDRDHRVVQAYGGDLQGNVWRFDLDKPNANDYSVAKLAVLTDAAGAALPVTTPPEVGEVEGQRMVFVGTGRLLGGNDHLSPLQHSVFGLYDRWLQPLPTNQTTHAPITRSELVKMKALAGNPDTPATASDPGVTCLMGANGAVGGDCDQADPGWVVDLVADGEHVNIPMTRVGRNLLVVTNEPRQASCSLGARSRLYQLSIESGKPLRRPMVIDEWSPVVGYSVYLGSDGDPYIQPQKGDAKPCVGDDCPPRPTGCVDVPGGALNCNVVNPTAPTQLNRLSWREL